MKCILVGYSEPGTNSFEHLVGFGVGLARHGWSARIATTSREPASTRGFDFWQCQVDGRVTLDSGSLRLESSEIVHLWTPRAPIWRFLQSFGARLAGPIILHLEDDETEVLSALAGERPPSTPCDLNRFIRRHAVEDWSHPILANCLSRACDAVTVLAPGLSEAPQGGSAVIRLTPPLAAEWFEPIDPRNLPGGLAGAKTIVYAGAVHPGVRDDFTALCQAVQHLDTAGYEATLVRTGPPIETRCLPPRSTLPSRFIDLGTIRVEALRTVLGTAAMVVQPGRPTKFNQNRFPAKIAPYLASGAPVVMPSCYGWAGIRDGDHAVTFDHGTPDDLAQVMCKVLDRPEQSKSMAERARAFARQHFDAIRCVKPLDELYRSLPARSKTPWRTLRTVRVELPLLQAADLMSATASEDAGERRAGTSRPLSVSELIETARLEMRDAAAGCHRRPMAAQVYWPVDGGYAEEVSERRMLRPGRWVRLRFGPHPVVRGQSPRLDPPGGFGFVSLGSVVYRDAAGRFLQRIAPTIDGKGHVTPSGTIVAATQDRAFTSRWLSSGEDPQWLLPAPACYGAHFIEAVIRWTPLD